MAINRILSSNSRIYVNNIPLTGITDCKISHDIPTEPLKNLGNYNTVGQILKSDRKDNISLSWNLGSQSSDAFFDFQTSGIVSAESFNIKVCDTVGRQTLSGAVLNSYSVKAGLGQLTFVEAQFEGDQFSFTTGEALGENDQTAHAYTAVIPQKITVSSNFPNGDICIFPLQSFSIDIPIGREVTKKIGDFSASYRLPVMPIEAKVSFSAIKNSITGIDLTSVLLKTGSFSFSLKTCSNIEKKYIISGCSLESLKESVGLNEMAMLDFNYIASINNQSFLKS